MKLPFLKQKENITMHEYEDPINLPSISEDFFNPIGIKEILNQDISIWAGFNALKSQDTMTLESISDGYFIGYKMLRKENEFLFQYRSVITPNGKIILKLECVYQFTNSNIQEIFSNILCYAEKSYIDSENLTSEIEFFLHDLTIDFLKNELENNYVFFVSDDHFVKKQEEK